MPGFQRRPLALAVMLAVTTPPLAHAQVTADVTLPTVNVEEPGSKTSPARSTPGIMGKERTTPGFPVTANPSL